MENKKDAYQKHLSVVNQYKKRNPVKTRYLDLRGAARGFVNPQPGSKRAEMIEWAGAQYYDDLRDLKARIEQRLKDQEDDHDEEGK